MSDNEAAAMAWRQFQLSAEQHKQLMFSTTPQMMMASPPPLQQHLPSTTAAAATSSGMLTLQQMIKQENFEKRRLSVENDYLDHNDIKLPKLTPISNMNNTCSSSSNTPQPPSLPLSLANMPLSISAPYYSDSQLSSNEVAAFSSMMNMSHREKLQNQQYLERLRRMNERGKERQMRSRVNFEPSHVAKTVREELASRKQHHSKQGKSHNLQQLHVFNLCAYLTNFNFFSSIARPNNFFIIKFLKS